jgi:CMP-N,N'-diacetyllegionaminic acid synthase
VGLEILGIIPARGGSKGVQRKNIRSLAGKPLLCYAIDAAQTSRSVGRVLVSTEDEEIARLAVDLGCEVLKRPIELAQDDTPMVPVIRHAIDAFGKDEGYQPKITVILQPTTPLRRAEHIDEALDLLLRSDAGSVISVTPVPGHYHPEWQFVISEKGELETYKGFKLHELKAYRQKLQETFTRNGAIYAFHTSPFLERDTFYLQPCLAYRMAPEVSVNIDTEEDFWLAEKYLIRDGRE